MYFGCTSSYIGSVSAQKQRSHYTVTSPPGIPVQAPHSIIGKKKRHRCANKEKDGGESERGLDLPSLTSSIYLQALKWGA